MTEHAASTSPKAADAIATTLAEIQDRLRKLEAELGELKDRCEDRQQSPQ